MIQVTVEGAEFGTAIVGSEGVEIADAGDVLLRVSDEERDIRWLLSPEEAIWLGSALLRTGRRGRRRRRQ